MPLHPSLDLTLRNCPFFFKTPLVQVSVRLPYVFHRTEAKTSLFKEKTGLGRDGVIFSISVFWDKLLTSHAIFLHKGSQKTSTSFKRTVLVFYMNGEGYLCRETFAGRLRQGICRSVTQPMTAMQLSKRLGRPLGRCCKALRGLRSHKIMRCLNPAAKRSRVFWFTPLGKRLRQHLGGAEPICGKFSHTDWKLYAKLCFNHRSRVIQTLTSPMQPAKIKRKAAQLFPGLRMSANNVRDVIRYLVAQGIVRPVKQKKRVHPAYELTELGQRMRRLFLRVCCFSKKRD